MGQLPRLAGLEITKILIKAREEILEGKRPAEPILKEASQRASALLPR